MKENNKVVRINRRKLMKSLGLAGSASLAGCLGGNGNGDGDGGNGDEVVFWSAWFDEEALDSWHDWYFQQVEEELNINMSTSSWHYDDLQESYLTGGSTGEPDLVNGVLEHLTDYVHAGLMEPLTERVETMENYDTFVDNALNALEFEGDLYAIPGTGNGRALIYRQDLFDEYGFEPPETAEEFHEIGRTIDSNEDNIAGYNNVTLDGDVRGFQEWISHVFQYVDSLYDLENGEWEVQIDAETLGQIYDDFYYQPWASDESFTNPDLRGAGYQQHDQGYARGQFAMMPIGPWIRASQLDAGPDAEEIITERSNIAHLPYSEGGERGTYLEVEWVGMNSYSENKDQAWEALELYTSTESLERYAEGQPGDWITPVNEEIESTVELEGWETFVEAFETGQALSFISWGTTRTAFYETMQQVVYGQEDPYAAGESLHEQLIEITAELEVPDT